MISIHAPRERSDGTSLTLRLAKSLFQSTLLVRGATKNSPRRQRRQGISIHAPRERSDKKFFYWNKEVIRFQSTLLVRGATFFM
mgnify:CR=1 FL=1